MREEARKVITALIQTEWTGVAIVWENHPAPPASRTSWARFGIMFGRSTPAAVGTAHHRMTGHVWAQVFLPDGKGMKEAATAADRLEQIVGARQIAISGSGWTGHVTFESSIQGPEQSGGREGYKQFLVRADFRADKITG